MILVFTSELYIKSKN